MHRDCPPFSYLYEDSLGLTFSHLFFLIRSSQWIVIEEKKSLAISAHIIFLRGEKKELREAAAKMRITFEEIVEPYLRGSLEMALGNFAAAEQHYDILRKKEEEEKRQADEAERKAIEEEEKANAEAEGVGEAASAEVEEGAGEPESEPADNNNEGNEAGAETPLEPAVEESVEVPDTDAKAD